MIDLELTRLSLKGETWAVNEILRLRDLVVMRFDMERLPIFSQGYQEHEVLEPVTADHCRWMVDEIERLNKEVNKKPTGIVTRVVYCDKTYANLDVAIENCWDGPFITGDELYVKDFT